MTTVKNLHVLISTFAGFCNKAIRINGDEIHLRLFLPPVHFHYLLADFEDSDLPQEPPELRLGEDNFEMFYRYVNVLLDIEEGRNFKLELISGTQQIETEFSGDDYVIPGRSPNTDYRPRFVA